MSERVKFTITAEMPRRWVDTFCSFLRRLEFDGNIGHSEMLGFYADGDGDFRPKFEIGTNYKRDGERTKEVTVKSFYDAG